MVAQDTTDTTAPGLLDVNRLHKVTEEASTTGKKNRVMIVEDEADAREIFIDLLKSADYEVLSAVDGGDALAKLEADKGNVDLVLLDIIMPNKDGVETLEEIINEPERYGTPKVVMLTNIGGDAAVEKAIELGALGYMLKSETEPDELIAAVGKYLTQTPPKPQLPSSKNDLLAA